MQLALLNWNVFPILKPVKTRRYGPERVSSADPSKTISSIPEHYTDVARIERRHRHCVLSTGASAYDPGSTNGIISTGYSRTDTYKHIHEYRRKHSVPLWAGN